MPWGVAAAAIGAYATSQAGKAGAKAQSNAANQANAEQQREFDLARQDQQPFLQAGQNAVNLQQRYLSGDTSGFQNSPDYQFAVSQGFKGLDAGAAARGNLWGGGTDADRIALGQGLATQYANNYWNKLAGMAGQGQGSAQNLGSLGANMANQVGQNLQNAGQARASSYANTANAWTNFGNQAANLAGQYYGNSPGGNMSYMSPSTSYGGTGSTSTYWPGQGTNNYSINF